VKFPPVRVFLCFTRCILALLVFHPAYGSAQTPQTEFFPHEVLFPRFLADGTAQQMSLNKDLHTRRLFGSIGGLERVFQLHTDYVTFQFGVGASVKGTFIKTPTVLQVVTADFFVDFPIECRISKNLLFRTGWGHHSGHFADDGIEMLKLASVNYAKDYVPLFCAYMLDQIGGFVYGGARLDYYTIPEKGKNWILQWGAEGGNFPISNGVRVYGTFDIKSRSEVAWATTQSYQVGVKFLQRELNAVRIAYTFRTGIAEQGQFYTERADLSLLGVYFDF
jgi:hypothetical protein